MSEFDEALDAKNLHCPLPILRAKKALKRLESEQVLKITATDPSTMQDFVSFCKHAGHELLLSEAVADEFVFLIKKV